MSLSTVNTPLPCFGKPEPEKIAQRAENKRRTTGDELHRSMENKKTFRGAGSLVYLSALRAVRHRASAAVIELDFLKLSPTFLGTLTFNNYRSEDARNSGGRKIEVSLKGTAVL